MPDRYRLGALAFLIVGLIVPDAWAGSGGAAAPGAPAVEAVTCERPNVCQAHKRVIRGQRLVIRGRNLTGVRRALFKGGRGTRDDVTAPVSRKSRTSASAVVPAKARTGPLELQGARRRSIARISRVVVGRAAHAEPHDAGPRGSFYYGGRRKPAFRFTVAQSSSVRVELVDEQTQAVVRGWDVAAIPGTTAKVTWDGRAPGGASGARRYRFRLAGASAARATPIPEDDAAFVFADHIFPIRGRHDLGQTPTNDFGGGGRRRHMGQDMFARCGTQLAAARAGTVKQAGYQSAAGNYLAIDGAGTGRDYVYMHMLKPARVRTGDRVFTGQAVGQVGESGRASGCHLHFEMWSAPGWYSGGRAFDPLPSLRAWDAYS